MIKVTISFASREDMEKVMRAIEAGELSHLGVIGCEPIEDEGDEGDEEPNYMDVDADYPSEEDLFTEDRKNYTYMRRRVFTVHEGESLKDHYEAFGRDYGVWPNVWEINDHGNVEQIDPMTDTHTGRGWV